MNKGPTINSTASFVEVEKLRKKLLESFSEIDELKSMVQQLSMENNKLKSRIEPDPAFDFDVQLLVLFNINLHNCVKQINYFNYFF